MRCPACNAVNPRSNKYCGSCGAALTLPCPQCGEGNAPAAQFCGACGEPLDAALREPAVEERRARSPWGELKQGTVLFADVVESTQMIAELDPEQAMERLRPSLRIMNAAVKRFGGTVFYTLGDGIMAVFGFPRAHDAHALLACQAAIAIQRAIEQDNRQTKVRVGLHSGELLVSQDDDGDEPIPHGATVHLASRLEQMAEPGAICMTGDCYRQVQQHCDARPLGERMAKGFSKPIETYALLGFKLAVTSQQFRALSLTPFYGRESELERLQQAFHRAERGEAKVVGIAGPAGTGKSRLCYEFAEWCRRRFVPTLEARALVSGQATPLQPILEFLRLFLGVAPSDEPAAARRHIAQHPSVAGLDRDIDLPLLYAFLGLSQPDSESPQQSPGIRQARLRQIVGHMVRQRGAQPFVIVFDDLHWLDAGSAVFVNEIVRAVADSKAILVVNFREPFAADWMTEPFYEQILLPDLDARRMAALVEQLLGQRSELNFVKRKIVTRSGGNPFFAEELVRSLAEREVITGELGDYRLGARSDQDILPATVQAIISARIDALPPQDRNVIHIAAIIGKEFPLSVVEKVAGMPRQTIEPILDRLHRARLVEPQLSTVEPKYFFRHPLIEEVAYNEQMKSRRSELHAAAASAMERHYAARLDEFAALIAYHHETAGHSVEAADYAARAAVWVGSAASSLALQHWHKVRQLLGDQPNSPLTDTLRMRASGQIAMFGWRQGMTAEEARPFIDEALGWARKIDNSMLPLLLAADGRIAVASGHAADAYVSRIGEALALAGEQDSEGRIATLNALLCHAKMWAGFLTEALEANGRALDGADSIDAFDGQFLGLNVEQWMKGLRGRILVRLGRFEEADRCLKEVLAIEESLRDPAVQFIPHLAYVDLAYFDDKPEIAQDHAARIGEIAEKGQNPYLEVYALGCLGAARLIARDFAGGACKLKEGLKFAQSTKAALEFEPEMMATLADCHYRAGDLDRAQSVARQTIELAQRRSARLAEMRALMTSASALVAAQGDERQAEALRQLDRADELLAATGACVFSQPLAELRAVMSETLRPATSPGGCIPAGRSSR